MRLKSGKTTVTLIVLNLAAVALILYLVSLITAYPLFHETRLVDPLAEIHALSPLYYLALALTAVLVPVCVWYRIGNRYLHLALLLLLAAMLWLTPYWLTDFVRLSDAPWHVGAALKIPQVLKGEAFYFSSYAWTYPGSFIFHYTCINLTDVEPLTYIYYFPLAAMFLFILLAYILLSKLAGTRTAILALLLAVPGLHYFQLHASPHVISIILMLAALLLLVKANIKRLLLSLVLIGFLIYCHAMTPLLLAIFSAAALISLMIVSSGNKRTRVILAGVLVFTLAGWFCFYFYGGKVNPFPYAFPVQSTGEALVSRILPTDLETSRQFMGGTPFIYANIYTLNKGIYILYGAVVMLLLSYHAGCYYLKKRNFKIWLSGAGGLKRTQLIWLFSVPLLFLFTLILAEEAHDLIETGLTWIIIAISCIIASQVIRRRMLKFKKALFIFIAGVIFLTLSYPFVAYSIDAYSNFPKSEKEGLKFLAADVPLEDKTLAGGFLLQLALFAPDYPLQGNIRGLAGGADGVDLAVFRNTAYYYSAIRFDLSFKINRYTRFLVEVQNLKYRKVYASPTFQVYLNNQQVQK